MKRNFTLTFLTVLLIITGKINAQSVWKEGFDSKSALIENIGQFDNRNWNTNKKIEFGYDHNPFYIFISKHGHTYRFDKFIKNPKRKTDKNASKRINKSEIINVEWINANPSPKVIKKDKTPYYFSYSYKDYSTGEIINKNKINGYQTITYKNLYPNIDIEYSIHPTSGVKYNIILHPGADISNIKLKYIPKHTQLENEKVNITLENNQILIKTSIGEVIEHAPVSFYNATNGEKIPTQYIFEDNILSFKVDNYDANKTLIIDPWIVSPTFSTSNAVWEVETDGAGNVYAIGGESPMKLKKYNSTGALQWTYNTPWDTANYWLGTLATDNAGNSYVTVGTSPEIAKIDNTGAQTWLNTSGGGTIMDEFWSITFNCDQSNLIVGGTSGNAFTFDAYATIFDIDINNGNVTNSITVEYTDISQFGAFPNEVRSIASSKNARYVYLTHDSLGVIDDNFGACPNPSPFFEVDNTHNLAYKCENYLPQNQNGGGLKALTANDNYIYTHDGANIYQWDLNTGALINSVAIPGGNNATTLGAIVVHNSGLDVDDCGNVYAGSGNAVVKFDPNLSILSQSSVSFTVYDVDVNSNGEVIACGAQSNNSSTSRNGRIESINMSACSPYALVCCDANFCPIDPLCPTDPAVTLSPNTSGGTWSISPSTPAFNASTGTFDPSQATPGTYTVTYTLSCGSSSNVIQVNSCVALSACQESNGDITVTSGSGPYQWFEWQSTTITPSNQTECTQCGGTWLFGVCTVTSCTVNGWANTGTGITYTPSSYPVKVVDSNGDSLVINSASQLSPCSITTPCDSTINPAGPFCTTDPTVNLTAVTPGGTWSGTGITNATNGTFDPSVAGAGTHTISYTPPCGSTGTIDIIVNAQADATITGTPYGPYCSNNPDITLTATDPGGTWSGTGITDATNGIFSPAIAGVGTHQIIYTISGTCGDTDTISITVTQADSAAFNYSPSVYCLTDPNPAPAITGTTGGTFSIDNGGTINSSTGEIDIAATGLGTFTVTYITSGACPDTATQTIVITNQADATITGTPYGPYCINDPNVTLSAATPGGTWSGTGIIDATNGIFSPNSAGVGTFTITYTISGNCGDTDSVSITVTPGDTATFSYPSSTYCTTDTNPVPTIAGTSGGTFTINNGGVINPSTGEIDINASGVGTFTVVYTTSGTCPASDSVTITITNCIYPIANFSVSDSIICQGECVDFTDMSNGSPTSWNWTFAGANPDSSSEQNPANICYDSAGVFIVQLIVSNANGADTTTSSIFVSPLPTVDAGNDTTINGGQTVTLNANGTGTSYTWSPSSGLSCTTCPNPSVSPDETTTYTVITTDSVGCVASDQITIYVDYEYVIYIPNIFSPNGDGKNDILYVRGKGIKTLYFAIYDRWGEKVFETTDLNNGWDGTFKGKPLNKAVFVYYVKATFVDNSEVEQKGDITLIR